MDLAVNRNQTGASHRERFRNTWLTSSTPPSLVLPLALQSKMAAPNPGSSFSVPQPSAAATTSTNAPKKRKGHRAGKKRKNRTKSFAITNDEMNHDEGMSSSLANHSQSFYGQPHNNLSGTSLESSTLLDHRLVALLPCLPPTTLADHFI